MLGLDDLLALPSVGSHPQAAKLKLTAALPRAPGVYLFRDRTGRVLYVGKATNLRARVRSYFSTDDRRKVGPAADREAGLDHIVTSHLLAEAASLELRLIHEHQPTYNRRGKGTGAAYWLKLTLGERCPRLASSPAAATTAASTWAAAVAADGAPGRRGGRAGHHGATVPAAVHPHARATTRARATSWAARPARARGRPATPTTPPSSSRSVAGSPPSPGC